MRVTEFCISSHKKEINWVAAPPMRAAKRRDSRSYQSRRERRFICKSIKKTESLKKGGSRSHKCEKESDKNVQCAHSSANAFNGPRSPSCLLPRSVDVVVSKSVPPTAPGSPALSRPLIVCDRARGQWRLDL